MIKIISFLLVFFAIVTVSAQHDKVLEIREYYKAVKAHSGNAEQDSIWYYSDQIIRNTNDHQWRAIGIFHDTLTFWYSDLMEASMQENNNTNDSAWALVLVTSSAQMSGITQYREWLFQDGKLVFHFDKMNGYDPESTWEYRYYFDNNKLIRTMSGGQIIQFDETPADVLNSAKEVMQTFKSIINL